MVTIVDEKHGVKPGLLVESWEVIGKPFKCGKRWFCVAKCTCQTFHVVRTDVIAGGGSRCCLECKATNRLGFIAHQTHGKSKTLLYGVWRAMKGRCLNQNDKSFEDYGGRGIDIHPAWINDFACFYEWAIAAGYRIGLHMDRRDNNRGYSPDNCRFITQARNNLNRRVNVILFAFGESKTMLEWSEDSRCNVSYKTLEGRIKHGWFHELAITKPAKQRKRSVANA